MKHFITKAILLGFGFNLQNCFARQEFVVKPIPEDVWLGILDVDYQDSTFIKPSVASKITIIKIWDGLQRNLKNFYDESSDGSLQDHTLAQQVILAKVQSVRHHVFQFYRNWFLIDDSLTRDTIKISFEVGVAKLIERMSESVKTEVDSPEEVRFLGSLLDGQENAIPSHFNAIPLRFYGIKSALKNSAGLPQGSCQSPEKRDRRVRFVTHQDV